MRWIKRVERLSDLGQIRLRYFSKSGFGLGLLLTVAVLFDFASNAFARDPDDSLLAFAISIRLSSATQSWTGSGIYLGDGLFITAAHLVGQGRATQPRIVISGDEYPTRIVKEGNFEGTDLTLMSVEQALLPMRHRLRRLALCKKPPWPGEQVITVAPQGTARSSVMSPERLPVGTRRFGTVIADVAHTGNSGSGVFDAQDRCLLGIMSRKISQSRSHPDNGKSKIRDIAKYFVPASEIASFLPTTKN